MGSTVWAQYSAEHGIEKNDEKPLTHDDGTFQCVFEETGAGRYMPRMVAHEPNVIDDVIGAHEGCERVWPTTTETPTVPAGCCHGDSYKANDKCAKAMAGIEVCQSVFARSSTATHYVRVPTLMASCVRNEFDSVLWIWCFTDAVCVLYCHHSSCLMTVSLCLYLELKFVCIVCCTQTSIVMSCAGATRR